MDSTEAHLLTERKEFEVDYNTKRKTTLRNKVIGAVAICLAVTCAIVIIVYFTVYNSSEPPFAEVQCSGYGYLQVDNLGACVCFPCRQGDDCSEVVEDCEININMGQPRLLQSYWANVGVFVDALLPPYFKPFYGDTVPSLDVAIQNLHAMIGNANATGKSIVLGYGGTNVLMAAIYAINTLEGRPLTLFAPIPHYTYKDFAAPLGWGSFNDSLYLNESDVIEVVTTINNPTCEYRSKHYSNARYYIYDMVYYWPSYTEINRTLDEDIMVFSASKSTGHAGNRLGWALVRNPEVAQLMQRYIMLTAFGYSTDLAQKFQLIFNHVISTNGEVFMYAKERLAARYVKLLEILGGQEEPNRFTLTSEVGGFYLFIRCNLPADADCLSLFMAGGVIGRTGTAYGVGPEYVRFNFMIYDNEADTFFSYLYDLIHTPEKSAKRLAHMEAPVRVDDHLMMGC